MIGLQWHEIYVHFENQFPQKQIMHYEKSLLFFLTYRSHAI
jgi:hypothetical protein